MERAYNASGHLARVTDPDGIVVAYEVDAVGRVLAEVLAPETDAPERTSYAYDAMGRLTEVVRPRHQGTDDVARRLEWDGLGRLARVGNETNYGWNVRDQLGSVWEGPVGGAGVQASFYTYTAMGYLTRHAQRVGPDGAELVTEWLEHSGEGLPGVVRTARGEEHLTYDEVGRVEESTVVALAGGIGDLWRPLSRTWAYDDEEGRVLLTEVSLDPDGADVVDKTCQVFDQRGWLRVEEVVRPEGSLLVQLDYDRNGNRTMQRTVPGEVTGACEEDDSGNGGGTGWPEGEEAPAETTNWSWDSRNRLQSLVTPGGTSTWRHTPGGRVSRIDYANETRASFVHNLHTGRLSGITHREGVAASAAVMAAVNYTYDVNGNRASQELSIGGVTETTTYRYDALDQLRAFSVLPGAGSEAEPRHTWYGHERYRRVYEGRCRGGNELVENEDAPHGFACAPPVEDAEGNVVEPGGVQTMARALTYDGLHGQVSEIADPLAVHSAGEGEERVLYLHDLAGNLVERRRQTGWEDPPCPMPCGDGSNPDDHDSMCEDGTEPECPDPEPVWQPDYYRYDALNRLAAVARGPPQREGLEPALSEEPTVRGVYGYNADGLRTRVRESGRNADAWYDGLALLVERVEQNGAAPTLVRYHHDTGGLHAITAVHGDNGNDRSTHFAHRDGMGSTLVVSRPDVGALGLVAASYRTDPWGLVVTAHAICGT